MIDEKTIRNLKDMAKAMFNAFDFMDHEELGYDHFFPPFERSSQFYAKNDFLLYASFICDVDGIFTEQFVSFIREILDYSNVALRIINDNLIDGSLEEDEYMGCMPLSVHVICKYNEYKIRHYGKKYNGVSALLNFYFILGKAVADFKGSKDALDRVYQFGKFLKKGVSSKYGIVFEEGKLLVDDFENEYLDAKTAHSKTLSKKMDFDSINKIAYDISELPLDLIDTLSKDEFFVDPEKDEDFRESFTLVLDYYTKDGIYKDNFPILSANNRYMYGGSSYFGSIDKTMDIDYFTNRPFAPKTDPTNLSIQVGPYTLFFKHEHVYNVAAVLMKWSDERFFSGEFEKSLEKRRISYPEFFLSEKNTKKYNIFVDDEDDSFLIDSISYKEYDDFNYTHSDGLGNGLLKFYSILSMPDEVTPFPIRDYLFVEDEDVRHRAWIWVASRIGGVLERNKRWIESGFETNPDTPGLQFYFLHNAEHLYIKGDIQSYTLAVTRTEDGWGGIEFQLKNERDYYQLGAWLTVALSYYCHMLGVEAPGYGLIKYWPWYYHNVYKKNIVDETDYGLEDESIAEDNLPTKYHFFTNEAKKNDDVKDVNLLLEELNALVGLNEIKQDVKELISLVKMQQLRLKKGMKSVPVTLHLVFTGNPGTGKTSVARILAKIYKSIGVLKEGQLVEVDRSDLVAGYVGQTAIKTQEKIQEALGGVLFIDEAYSLNKEGNDFGQEAIDTLLKAMEDHRDEFVVIVAGYTDLMRKFINSNPGLKSRFNKYFEFPDYSGDELKDIFMRMTMEYEYVLTEEAKAIVYDKIDQMIIHKDENFANAREVRNMFESAITNQALRLANQPDGDITLLTREDFE